ncbi:MAG: hypothetical protein WA003_05940 [Desulfuromonadaceae bacterium]
MNELVGTSVLGFPVYRSGTVSKTVVAHANMIQWQKGAADSPDQWLRALVARYLELFYVKRLEGHPAAESLPIVAESWVEDIGYNLTEEVDADRVQRGFMLLSRSIRKWPQPCELVKAMPGRVMPRSTPTPPTPPDLPLSGEEPGDVAAEAIDAILESLT